MPLVAILLLVLALAAAPASAQVQAQARPATAGATACAAGGSVTVARGVQARVYVRAQRGDGDRHELVGCLLGSGRKLLLDSWFSCGCSRGDESAPQVWLRGTVVAINRYGCPPGPELGPCVGRVRSVALRSGRTLREVETGGLIGQLVLGERGAFALSVDGAVRKADADGVATLDRGPGVEDGSLALAGPLLYWTRDGAPHSARLRFR